MAGRRAAAAWLEAVVPVPCPLSMQQQMPSAIENMALVRTALKFAAQRFSALPRFTEPQLQGLANVMETRTFAGGDSIIVQGATDDSYYVLASGECKVIVDGSNVGKVAPGTGFGEVALTLETPRTASVVATTPCTVYQLRRARYQSVVNYHKGLVQNIDDNYIPAQDDWRDRIKAQKARTRKERQ